MVGVAIERNAKAMKMYQRPFIPVVAVGMRQEHRVNALSQVRPHGSQPRAQKCAGPKARVQEDAKAVHLNQAGIAGTAAG